MVLVVSVAFSQRPEPTAQKLWEAEQLRTKGLEFKQDKDDYPLDTLLPGNWENRTGVALYWWGEAAGYFFGTNTYLDKGYGQKFPVESGDSYFIYGALYWLGFAQGTTGDVVFTIWDWDEDEQMPGDPLATSVVPLANVNSSTSFAGAFYVEFLDSEGYPLLHTDTIGSYVIGVDVQQLDGYQPGAYGLGNYSSMIGDGDERNLSWIWEQPGWVQPSVYVGGSFLDVAIFPLVSEEYFNILFPVTFNVDMTDAIYGDGNEFDPDAHEVHIAGSFIDWPQPGSLATTKMELVHPNESQVLMEENFDGGAIPAGWQNIDGNEDGYSWKIVTKPAYDPAVGEFAAMSQSWTQETGDVDPDNWLITPRMQVAYADYHLHFKVKPQDPNHPAEKYSVLVSTTTDDPDSFDEIHTETLSGGAWKDVSLPLADYHGEHIYIAFRHWDCEGNFEILLDAIKVEGTPPLIYTISFDNVDIAIGLQEYKYFVVEDDPTWDFGEWIGDPNRGINIEGEMATHDIWGEPVLFDVVFTVVDEAGEPVEDAVIIFDGEENDAGDYEFEAIIGDYGFRVEREDYHDFTGAIEVRDADIAENVTLQLKRTLEFIVEDEADDFIEGLFIGRYSPAGAWVGDFLIHASEYIFENLRADTEYQFLISDRYSAALAGTYENVYLSVTLPADVDVTEHKDTVTMKYAHWIEFFLDMSGATFDHFGVEVDFNPNAHDVYVSTSINSWAPHPDGYNIGAMAQWAVPGSANSQRLNSKLTDADNDGIYYTWLRNPHAAGKYEYKYFVVQNNVPGWMHPEYDEKGHNRTLTIVDQDVTLHDVWGAEPFHVTFNLDMSGEQAFDPASDVVYITGSFIGWAEPGTLKHLQEFTQVDDSDIFTITIPMPAGEYEYKYFIGDGWDGGEWIGDPNRIVIVEEDMTVDDFFGDITFDTGTTPDISLYLYPNPAREQLTVRSTGNISNVEVFNLTGHKVYDANVNDNSAVINVSGFNRGIYILRVQTEQGIENHKFQVIR